MQSHPTLRIREANFFYTEYVHFWSLEYGVFHGIRGIRVEYGRIQASGRSFGIRGKRIQTVGAYYLASTLLAYRRLKPKSVHTCSCRCEHKGFAVSTQLLRLHLPVKCPAFFSVKLHCEKDRKREKKRARSARRRRAAPPQAADSRCAKLNAIFGSAVLPLTSNVGMID